MITVIKTSKRQLT